MTKHEKIEVAEKAQPTGLNLLREPFPANQISKLPKPTKAQTDEVRNDFKKGIRCEVCGGWHHPKVVHLDYVGHAALTDRLLDCDPHWNWEPMAFSEKGTPLQDENGGMWIKLTVCGVTRFGYGHPDGKRGGDAIKEVIGDALRNAAMRFGAALDLWHKGQLHQTEEEVEEASTITPDQFIKLRDLAKQAGVSSEKLCANYGCAHLEEFPADKFAAAVKKLNATIEAKPKPDVLDGDEIPEFEKEQA